MSYRAVDLEVLGAFDASGLPRALGESLVSGDAWSPREGAATATVNASTPGGHTIESAVNGQLGVANGPRIDVTLPVAPTELWSVFVTDQGLSSDPGGTIKVLDYGQNGAYYGESTGNAVFVYDGTGVVAALSGNDDRTTSLKGTDDPRVHGCLLNPSGNDQVICGAEASYAGIWPPFSIDVDDAGNSTAISTNHILFTGADGGPRLSAFHFVNVVNRNGASDDDVRKALILETRRLLDLADVLDALTIHSYEVGITEHLTALPSGLDLGDVDPATWRNSGTGPDLTRNASSPAGTIEAGVGGQPASPNGTWWDFALGATSNPLFVGALLDQWSPSSNEYICDGATVTERRALLSNSTTLQSYAGAQFDLAVSFDGSPVLAAALFDETASQSILNTSFNGAGNGGTHAAPTSLVFGRRYSDSEEISARQSALVVWEIAANGETDPDEIRKAILLRLQSHFVAEGLDSALSYERYLGATESHTLTLAQILGSDDDRAALGDPETGGASLVEWWDAADVAGQGSISYWAGRSQGRFLRPYADTGPSCEYANGVPTVRATGASSDVLVCDYGSGNETADSTVLVVGRFNTNQSGSDYLYDGAVSSHRAGLLGDGGRWDMFGPTNASDEAPVVLGQWEAVMSRYSASDAWQMVGGRLFTTGGNSGSGASRGFTLFGRHSGDNVADGNIAGLVHMVGSPTRWQTYQLHRWAYAQFGDLGMLGEGWGWDEHTDAAPNPKELLFAALQPPRSRWRAPLTDSAGHQLAAFLDGASLGDVSSAVAQWPNAADGQHPLSRTTGSWDPTIVEINGRKVVGFDGGNNAQRLIANDLPGLSFPVLAMVARADSGDTDTWVRATADGGAGGEPSLYTTGTSLNCWWDGAAGFGSVASQSDWHAAWWHFSAAASPALRRHNGTFQDSGALAGSSQSDGLVVGGAPSAANQVVDGQLAALIYTGSVDGSDTPPTPYQCAVLDAYLAYVSNAVNGGAVYPSHWPTDGVFDWRAASFLPLPDNQLDLNPQTRSATSGESDWADQRARFNFGAYNDGTADFTRPDAVGEGLEFSASTENRQDDSLEEAGTSLVTPGDMTWAWLLDFPTGETWKLAGKYGGTHRYFQLSSSGLFRCFDNATLVDFPAGTVVDTGNPMLIVLTHESGGGSYTLYVDGVATGTPTGTAVHNGSVQHDQMRLEGNSGERMMWAHARWAEVLDAAAVARLTAGVGAFNEALHQPGPGLGHGGCARLCLGVGLGC